MTPLLYFLPALTPLGGNLPYNNLTTTPTPTRRLGRRSSGEGVGNSSVLEAGKADRDILPGVRNIRERIGM
jgi:hypothetical protein